MNKVKYQIFISSTYTDLIEEREQVIKACLEMGHIPVGMEMFSAADEEQWQIITRQIDDSDYYVLILANRYGSITGGIGYTEKEYNYAVSKGIPVLGFVLDAKALWPSDRAEGDPKVRTKLEAFKKKVKRKPVAFWTGKEDLHSKCSIALMKTFNTQPRPGWVRSPDAVGPEVIEEITRLSSENAKLREQVAELGKTPDTSGFAQEDDEISLEFRVPGRLGYDTVELTVTWNTVFRAVATCLLGVSEESKLKQSIADIFAAELSKLISEDLKNSLFHNPNYVEDKSIDVIKVQLMALGFIRIEYLNDVVWKLTTQGEQLYISLTAIRR